MLDLVPPPPPPVRSLPAGYRLRAGLGWSTVLPSIDFEVYSEAGFLWDKAAGKWEGPPNAAQGKKGLPVVGAAIYAMHPSTEILSAAYDLKDGRGPRLWRQGDPPPLDLFAHVAAGGLLEAWNSPFEAWIWDEVAVRMGWPPMRPEQWRCAMAKARAFALPGALAKAAAVMGTTAKLDGGDLIRRYCIPRNPTKNNPARRHYLGDDAAKTAQFYEYNGGDIVAEDEIAALVPDQSPEELAIWQADARINRRGVAVSTPDVEACCAIIDQAHARYNVELGTLTGGTVERASEVQKLQGWLGARGVHLASLDEEAVEEALKTLPAGIARRALEIRAAVGSAAVKKAYALRNRTAPTGRVHDLFNYHAARTGRVTGDGPQPTNFPNSGPEVKRCPACGGYHAAVVRHCPACGADNGGAPTLEWCPEAVEHALALIRCRMLDLLEAYYPDGMAAVSGCLRGLFVASPGHDLICSDYSAIEAVVLAALAGEEWRLEVFRTHGMIYETSASRITGVPFEEFVDHKKRTGQHHPLRKKIGKIAELASGYQGWIGAWKAFGADAFFTDDEIKDAILKWREASPAIVAFWGGQTDPARPRDRVPMLHGVEGCFIAACQSPGRWFEFRGLGFIKVGDAVTVRLLSGRPLTYHRPRLVPSDRRAGELSISYEGWNSNPKNGPTGWIRMDTWGGRLTENIVQATARDIQWHAIIQQEAAGYPIVLHVYDENVAEVPEGFGSVEEFEALMMRLPAWAADWPIRASGGWRRKRYGK